MGVLNVTPDSFHDGGVHGFDGIRSETDRSETDRAGTDRSDTARADTDRAVRAGLAMFAAGADIVDVGGESTRPGAAEVPAAVERARVLDVVRELAPYGRVSVDTRKAEVARAAVAAGASIVNDVSGSLGPLAGELGVGYVAMHMRGTPRTMQQAPRYVDVVAEVAQFLHAIAEEALRAGAPTVWIDPGFGFGKTLAHNVALFRAIPRLAASGFPVLVGVSRKTMVGQLTGRESTERRLPGSLAAVCAAAQLGADVVRVHDVPETVDAVRVARALLPAAVPGALDAATDPIAPPVAGVAGARARAGAAR
ncbi:dihydropteroate synthase [Kitasatospora sp. NPDC101183]|uniref:dihydropteroate synthase n=1 Tax=Kitasatospora sp. NPDC101183 TaxID=3364100 RepID=UPI00380E87D0